MECCMKWVKMDNEIWCNGVWVKWIMEWNGSQLWSEVKYEKCPATYDFYYSIAEKDQI